MIRRFQFSSGRLFLARTLVAIGMGVGPIKKSFPRGRLRKVDGRVDIEVIKGLAFVPDQP